MRVRYSFAIYSPCIPRFFTCQFRKNKHSFGYCPKAINYSFGFLSGNVA